eukprot:3206022-Prymnesium_polylepis.1
MAVEAAKAEGYRPEAATPTVRRRAAAAGWLPHRAIRSRCNRWRVPEWPTQRRAVPCARATTAYSQAVSSSKSALASGRVEDVATSPCWSSQSQRLAAAAATATCLRRRCYPSAVAAAVAATTSEAWRTGHRSRCSRFRSRTPCTPHPRRRRRSPCPERTRTCLRTTPEGGSAGWEAVVEKVAAAVDARVGGEGAAAAPRDHADLDHRAGACIRHEERAARVPLTRVLAAHADQARAEHVGGDGAAVLRVAHRTGDDGHRHLARGIGEVGDRLTRRPAHALCVAPACHGDLRAGVAVARRAGVEDRQLAPRPQGGAAARVATQHQEAYVGHHRALVVVCVTDGPRHGDGLGAGVGRRAGERVAIHHRPIDGRRQRSVDTVRRRQHPLLVDQRAAAEVAIARLRERHEEGIPERRAHLGAAHDARLRSAPLDLRAGRGSRWSLWGPRDAEDDEQRADCRHHGFRGQKQKNERRARGRCEKN